MGLKTVQNNNFSSLKKSPTFCLKLHRDKIWFYRDRVCCYDVDKILFCRDRVCCYFIATKSHFVATYFVANFVATEFVANFITRKSCFVATEFVANFVATKSGFCRDRALSLALSRQNLLRDLFSSPTC